MELTQWVNIVDDDADNTFNDTDAVPEGGLRKETNTSLFHM